MEKKITGPKSPWVLAARLSLPRDKEALFRDDEAKAVLITARYGGRIESVMKVSGEPGQNRLTEIHWVVFPAEASFEAYQKDEAFLAPAPQRLACEVETQIWRGQGRAPFSI